MPFLETDDTVASPFHRAHEFYVFAATEIHTERQTKMLFSRHWRFLPHCESGRTASASRNSNWIAAKENCCFVVELQLENFYCAFHGRNRVALLEMAHHLRSLNTKQGASLWPFSCRQITRQTKSAAGTPISTYWIPVE